MSSHRPPTAFQATFVESISHGSKTSSLSDLFWLPNVFNLFSFRSPTPPPKKKKKKTHFFLWFFYLLFSNSFFTNIDENGNGDGNSAKDMKPARKGTSHCLDGGTTHIRSSVCSSSPSSMHRCAVRSTSCGKCRVPSCPNRWSTWAWPLRQSKTHGCVSSGRKSQWWPNVTRSQVTGWNPLEGFTKSSCGKLKLGGTLPASNSRKG
jgi:hypothetical protein